MNNNHPSKFFSVGQSSGDCPCIYRDRNRGLLKAKSRDTGKGRRAGRAQQNCYKLFQQLVTSSCNLTICQQVGSDNLVATWWNKSIVKTCWQACYKSVANTSCWQVVRFLRVQGVSKKTLRKFNRLLCIINLTKLFNFYIARKSCYLAFLWYLS
jgi:hypothetical protein